MKKVFISEDFNKTKKLGELFAKELRGGEVLCLCGELGAGKTTFAQGVLSGLGAKGPFISPTFIILKEYNLIKRSRKSSPIRKVFHLDAYRIKSQDLKNIGWEELFGKHSAVIIEWAERIVKSLPENVFWIKFTHLEENKRRIEFSSRLPSVLNLIKE